MQMAKISFSNAADDERTVPTYEKRSSILLESFNLASLSKAPRSSSGAAEGSAAGLDGSMGLASADPSAAVATNLSDRPGALTVGDDDAVSVANSATTAAGSRDSNGRRHTMNTRLSIDIDMGGTTSSAGAAAIGIDHSGGSDAPSMKSAPSEKNAMRNSLISGTADGRAGQQVAILVR